MKLRKSLLGIALGSFIFTTTGCGLLLHPERQGQTGGRIDPAVAILDGVGLLLYLIPGLVAFAVDFHTGTIYLPNTQAGVMPQSEDQLADNMRAITVEGEMTEENIEAAIERELGFAVDISAENVQISEATSLREDVLPTLATYHSGRVQL